MIAFLVHPVIVLVPTVLAYSTGATSAIGVGPNSIGFTKIFYEFTSAAANNGSDFLGASANTPFFNISTAIVMLLGRFAPIGLLLALGGSMINRKRLTTDVGVRTDSFLFSIVIVGSILVLVLPVILCGGCLDPPDHSLVQHSVRCTRRESGEEHCEQPSKTRDGGIQQEDSHGRRV